MDWVWAFLVVAWSGLDAPVPYWVLLFLGGLWLLARRDPPERYG